MPKRKRKPRTVAASKASNPELVPAVGHNTRGSASSSESSAAKRKFDDPDGPGCSSTPRNEKRIAISPIALKLSFAPSPERERALSLPTLVQQREAGGDDACGARASLVMTASKSAFHDVCTTPQLLLGELGAKVKAGKERKAADSAATAAQAAEAPVELLPATASTRGSGSSSGSSTRRKSRDVVENLRPDGVADDDRARLCATVPSSLTEDANAILDQAQPDRGSQGSQGSDSGESGSMTSRSKRWRANSLVPSHFVACGVLAGGMVVAQRNTGDAADGDTQLALAEHPLLLERNAWLQAQLEERSGRTSDLEQKVRELQQRMEQANKERDEALEQVTLARAEARKLQSALRKAEKRYAASGVSAVPASRTESELAAQFQQLASHPLPKEGNYELTGHGVGAVQAHPRVVRQLLGKFGRAVEAGSRLYHWAPPVPPFRPEPELAVQLRQEALPPPSEADNYELTDHSVCSDEEEEEVLVKSPDRERRDKHIPSWSENYLAQLEGQAKLDPDCIFGRSVPPCILDDIFPEPLYRRFKREPGQRKRGSSGNWDEDKPKLKEVRAYKARMGQTETWRSHKLAAAAATSRASQPHSGSR